MKQIRLVEITWLVLTSVWICSSYAGDTETTGSNPICTSDNACWEIKTAQAIFRTVNACGNQGVVASPLTCTGYSGFGVFPPGATVSGVAVAFRLYNQNDIGQGCVNDGTLISASLTNGGTIIATKTLNQPIPGGGPGCNAPLFTIGADQDTWGLAQGTITPAMVTSGSLGISITTQLGDKRDFFAYPFAAITMNVWYSTNPCPPSIPAVCCPDQTLQVAGCNYQSVCGGSGGTLPPINSLPFPLPVLSSGLGTCGVATGATTQNYTLPFTYNGQPYYNLPILGLSSGGTCTACTIKQLP